MSHTHSDESIGQGRAGRILTTAAVLLALGALLLGMGRPARADLGRCDAFVRAELAGNTISGWSRVIVTTGGPLTLAQEKQVRALNADITRRFSVIRGFACSVPRRNLAALTDLSFVRRVSADTRVVKNDEFTVGGSGADVAFSQYRLDGKGIGVAVVDSGVNSGTATHPDLRSTKASRVVAAINFVSGETTTGDRVGHGTHVAGIIAGSGASSTGNPYTRTFYGIARGANIVSLRVLKADGSGNVSDVIAAVQWAVANKAAYNIRVMNLSLGHPVGESYATDPLCQALESAWKAGILVVVAAGNSGRQQNTFSSSLDNEGYGTAYGSIQSPGNDPYVLTVGAMKTEGTGRAFDRIATYSSRGPSRLDFVLKPDIVAPGNRVVSLTCPNSTLSPAYNSTNLVPWSSYATGAGTSQYFKLSGTSMAAPVVAGAAALMLQANARLTPDTVKARLMIAADKWGFADGTTDVCSFGAGYLNIPAALNCTATTTQYAISPALTRDADGNVIVVLDKAIWGVKAIWGTGINDLKAIWGVKAIWGTDTLSSSKAIWGKTLWGDKAIWGVSTGTADLSSTVLFGE